MSTALDGTVTLEVAVDPHSSVAAQLETKADVLRAMHMTHDGSTAGPLRGLVMKRHVKLTSARLGFNNLRD